MRYFIKLCVINTRRAKDSNTKPTPSIPWTTLMPGKTGDASKNKTFIIDPSPALKKKERPCFLKVHCMCTYQVKCKLSYGFYFLETHHSSQAHCTCWPENAARAIRPFICIILLVPETYWLLTVFVACRCLVSHQNIHVSRIWARICNCVLTSPCPMALQGLTDTCGEFCITTTTVTWESIFSKTG